MASDPAQDLRARLRIDLKRAMQVRQTDEMRTLRALIAAIDNAQAAPLGGEARSHGSESFAKGAAEVPRRHLSESDLAAVLAHEEEDRRTAAAELARLGEAERAALLETEATIVARYRVR